MSSADIQLIIQDYQNHRNKTFRCVSLYIHVIILYICIYIYILYNIYTPVYTVYIYVKRLLCPLQYNLPSPSRFHFRSRIQVSQHLTGDAATVPNSPGANRLLGACEEDHSGALWHVWRFTSWDALLLKCKMVVTAILGCWVDPTYNEIWVSFLANACMFVHTYHEHN